MAQLVRSLLGSRTRDEVSWRVYRKLVHLFPQWADLAAASPEVIEAAIIGVTHFEKKAKYIDQALRLIATDCPDYSIDFLGDWPTCRALVWLRRLNGVGPKIAAATLNFSTLCMPAFVVDTHVLRVLQRFGLVGPRADTEKACLVVMSAAKGWSAGEPEELHVLLKRLGQTRCKHGLVGCEQCPLNASCKRVNLPGIKAAPRRR